jgi:hypothetical protein
MEDSMDILHINRKGKLLSVLEWFHNYDNREQRVHLNNTYRNAYSPTFDTITNHKAVQHTTVL